MTKHIPIYISGLQSAKTLRFKMFGLVVSALTTLLDQDRWSLHSQDLMLGDTLEARSQRWAEVWSAMCLQHSLLEVTGATITSLMRRSLSSSL